LLTKIPDPIRTMIQFFARLREDESMTKRRHAIASTIALLFLGGIAILAHRYWSGAENSDRESALSVLPSDASAVLYADAAELRDTPFIAALREWAPKPQQVDADYAQFLRDTGFDYERDLDRVAIAVIKHGQDTKFFAVVDGRFDRKKINTYVSQFGTHASVGGREIFTAPISGGARKISFAFLRQNRIALTDAADFPALLAESGKGDDKEWPARFNRLAGSPFFAVVRQDAAAGTELAAHSPGGLQSQQLSALLDQLQWITFAGKPEGDHLRIVIEGENPTDAAARQLSDVLNGVLILAQAGLNGPKVRQQLDPQAREAYLEILKGTDISRIDRGDTKSVRVIFDLTPKLLAAARAYVPTPPPQQRSNGPAGEKSRHK
jgi:hypothetical protein